MSNTPIITYSQSNKGERVVIYDGYYLNNSCSKVKYWRCENQVYFAVLHIDPKEQFKTRIGDHSSHLSSPKYIGILNFKSNIKQRIITEATPVGRIYDEGFLKLN